MLELEVLINTFAENTRIYFKEKAIVRQRQRNERARGRKLLTESMREYLREREKEKCLAWGICSTCIFLQLNRNQNGLGEMKYKN